MKKFLVFILSLLYIIASSGVTMHLHYCMGKLVDGELTKNIKAEKCQGCGMNKAPDKGCCKDEHKQLKTGDQKLVDANGELAHLASVAIVPSRFEVTFGYIQSITEVYPLTNAPPPVQDIPLFICNCVFRI